MNVMNKNFWFLILIITSTFTIAQTGNKNLNTQLEEMKEYLLEGDYENYTNYVYPKLIEMVGGKENMKIATESGINSMKAGGLSIINLIFKNPNKFLKKDDELQCSLTQVTVMQTPDGKIEEEYALIAISDDKGENWTFINTDGKDKETVLKAFPNLHREVVIKQSKQKKIE